METPRRDDGLERHAQAHDGFREYRRDVRVEVPDRGVVVDEAGQSHAAFDRGVAFGLATRGVPVRVQGVLNVKDFGVEVAFRFLVEFLKHGPLDPLGIPDKFKEVCNHL